jgi:exoribonuclease-2
VLRSKPSVPNFSAPHENPVRRNDRQFLICIARVAMLNRGLEPDMPPEALEEVTVIQRAPVHPRVDAGCRDLRDSCWVSIDNDDSRDLDQLTLGEALPNCGIRILVAIADVDQRVPKGSPIDLHARHNTTSVYTPAIVFPMLPEVLSTDLTSLNQDEDRIAMVVEMSFKSDGAMVSSTLYSALVRNHAKLAYRSVAAWLEGKAAPPPGEAGSPRIEESLQLQDTLARRLCALRHREGALTLETPEPHAVFQDDALAHLDLDPTNRARQIIEEFMVAANGVTATFLAEKRFPSLRRVLRSPERWNRIVALAARYGLTLPDTADSKALESFLSLRHTVDPDHFPDLSLAVVKLIGRGEYVVELAGGTSPGHFGLAVENYSHSTAPNRRYPDLITQRLLKAALSNSAIPYTSTELDELARHCTEREQDATKVERRTRKSAAALLLSDRIGTLFDALVTGASVKGVWVRTFLPSVEGQLVKGGETLDVGDRVRVKLVLADPERGFIDFVREPA